MTDVRAEDLNEGDRLPWLEAVEDDDGGDGPSTLKLIVAVLIGLAAIGGIVGGLFWLGNRHAPGSATGEPETIKAPEGAYKVRPQNPGGMTVQGQGDTSFAASAGAEPKGRIDASKMPEAPVTATRGAAPAAQPQPQPKVAPVQTRPAQPKPQTQIVQIPKPQPKPQAQVAQVTKPRPAAPARPEAAPVASGEGGGSIQLGAFSSQAGAEKAWKALSGRFSYVAPLNHSVIPVTTGGRTLYRLRAGGAGASDICSRLKVAGETCVSLD